MVENPDAVVGGIALLIAVGGAIGALIDQSVKGFFIGAAMFACVIGLYASIWLIMLGMDS